MEGWLFIFDAMIPASSKSCSPIERLEFSRREEINFRNQGDNTETRAESDGKQPLRLDVLYDQRMPANCKELLLADLDGDGQNEIIIGLTDRVLRTYKWIKIGPNRGKFVGLYKWEFADQIGSVSLNPSRHENCQDILVAQPGGTYAKLECFDKNPLINSSFTSDSPQDKKQPAPEQHQNPSDSPNDDDNVKTEYINKLTPEYHQLALTQMRNHHVSTEVLGSIRNGRNSEFYSLIVIATLDGTLMLVNKDEILWSLQVDHQLFALAVLEPNNNHKIALPQSESSCTIVPNVESNSPCVSKQKSYQDKTESQYFVACAWNGKTYIIDEERNYLRFKFDEAVSAFTAGNYYFDDEHHASLVYATFNNQIILYYDVVSDNIRPDYLLNEVMNKKDNEDLLRCLESLAEKLSIPLALNESITECFDLAENEKATRVHHLLQDILYSISDGELPENSLTLVSDTKARVG